MTMFGEVYNTNSFGGGGVRVGGYVCQKGQRKLIVSCETGSCKSKRTITVIISTITIIIEPTVKCPPLLLKRKKKSPSKLISADLEAQIACFKALEACNLKLTHHDLKCLPPTLNYFHQQ